MWILCLAEDLHEISSLILSEKKTKNKYLWMLSAAVVFGTLRVKPHQVLKENALKKWNQSSTLHKVAFREHS